MCRFIETVRIENSSIKNIYYHNRRLNRTRKAFFPNSIPVDLEEIITHAMEQNTDLAGSEHGQSNSCLIQVRENSQENKYFKKIKTFKCRIVYSENIESVEILPYSVRQINSLHTVICNDIDYSFKYELREKIAELFTMKGVCDDILIIKNNLVTDTSFANVLFSDREKFYTPDSPLLKGTMREKLIYEKKVKEIKITQDDIKRFDFITLINAMIPPGIIKIPVENIVTG